MPEPVILAINAIFLPFIAAAAINLLPKFRVAISALAGGTAAYITYQLSQRVANGEVIEAKLLTIIENIPLAIKIEPLGIIYAGIASLLWIVTAVYAHGYLQFKNYGNQPRFFIYMAISIGCSIGLAFAGNLLTMLVFYEALTFATYPLVAHKGDEESIKGARRYLSYLLGSSLLFLIPAIIITYYLSGNISFTSGGVFNNAPEKATLVLLMLLFLYGIGKAAIMPLHGWLPAAMVAPTPVSALLHAVAVVKAGVYCVLKIIVYIFGIDMLKYSGATNVILYLSAITIICASVMAIFQDNIKKRLAYSTISQLSYIILAGSLLIHTGIIAAGTHIAAHAVGKITLFFAAGAIIISTSRYNISEFNGLGRKLPFVFTTFFIASLSIIGLPYLAGGESKHLIVEAAKEADLTWVVYLLNLSMVLNAVYFLPITYRAFFKKPDDDAAYTVPLSIKAAIFVTIALTLSFAIYKAYIVNLLGGI